MQAKRTEDQIVNAVKGCILGGAAGDALGYAIEFWGESQIFSVYGKDGIQAYELDPRSGKALISDDTQMSMFTANAVLINQYLGHKNQEMAPVAKVFMQAYFDWLRTQEGTIEEASALPKGYRDTWQERCISWIAEVSELYSMRAPGNTCLSSLRRKKQIVDLLWQNEEADFTLLDDETLNEYHSLLLDPLRHHINESRGCGGIMRVAPFSVAFPGGDIDAMDEKAGEIAAITHGESLGYMPAAVLNHILNRIVYPEAEMSLEEIIAEAQESMRKVFHDEPILWKLNELIDLAVELSANDRPDLENIHVLGEGWTGEEALVIALYCSLRYRDDFSKAIIAAVNHRGDSDSTGAIAGNIVGALVGFDRMDERWIKDLELKDVLLELAEDLGRHEYEKKDEAGNLVWERKYYRQ